MRLRRDCCEGFFLQDLAEEFEFVWLDEFVPSFMMSHGEYRQQFNKLTGRELVVVRAKNESQYEVDAANIRTIICSNEPPPTADYFLRRMFVVHATSNLYGGELEWNAGISVTAAGGAETVVRFGGTRTSKRNCRNRVGGHTASKRPKHEGGIAELSGDE
jgi:hypothetical protein